MTHRCAWLLWIIALVTAAAPASFSVTPDLTPMVPMRDGIHLATDVYFPQGSGPWPAVLTRTPYDRRRDSVDSVWVTGLCNRGYAYVVQDLRGRFASQGEDSTFWTDGWGELQDGYDTIEWIAAQNWCDGNVGMHGWSARGIVQYLAAGAAPPHLRACVVGFATEDFYHHAFFPGGELQKSLIEGWFHRQGAEGVLPFFYAHPLRDEFWDRLDLGTRVPLVTVPILHIGGFFDPFGESTIQAFTSLQERGGPGAVGNQKLVIGPWAHGRTSTEVQGEIVFPGAVNADLNAVRWRWLARWLKGELNGVEDEPAVSYYLMGSTDVYDGDTLGAAGNEWLDAERFARSARPTPYYLHGPGSQEPNQLLPRPPAVPVDGYSYVADPADPVPTLGGRNLFGELGPYDQRPVHEGRTDLFSVRTPVLEHPLTVVGKVLFRFWARCSTLDTDWVAKLIDVYPDGREMLITDGVLKARFRNGYDEEELLVPGQIYPFEIDLWSTAMVFAPGHQVQLTVANANYDRFEVNPQNGLPFGHQSPQVVAEVEVLTDAFHPSCLLLPIDAGQVVGVQSEFAMESRTLQIALAANPARAFEIQMDGTLDEPVTVGIYDVGGRCVRTLLAGARADGARVLSWDGRDAGGGRVADGVYFLGVHSGPKKIAARSLVLLDP